MEIELVQIIPSGLKDEEYLLRQTSLPRIVAECANTSWGGFVDTMRNQFPSEVSNVLNDSGHITVQLEHRVSSAREIDILNSARLLMACDTFSLRGARHAPAVVGTREPESVATYEQLAHDRAVLHDGLSEVLVSDTFSLPALPSGASTHASDFDGVGNLMQRLALFDHVYVPMPFNASEFEGSVGATFLDFLDVLPTGRVIPVFTQRHARYEAGLTTRVLEAGAPRVMLQGEHTLRVARGFYMDHHAGLSEVGSERGTETRAILAEGPQDETTLYKSYLDALADIIGYLPAIAIRGEALIAALSPLAEWLDKLRGLCGQPSRDLELAIAIEHRAMTESMQGVPMVQSGSLFDSGLGFLYGVLPTEGVLRVPEPDMIGRISFPDTKGLTLREFVDSFSGAKVTAMRELMLSKRVQTADGSVDLVRAFNAELRRYASRTEVGQEAVTDILSAVGAFVMGVPLALAGFALNLASRIMARRAPGALATITARMTGTTREAALFALVRRP
jgi:hypothetical protein